ncbi:Teichuronic acid biosynthesis protein TuaB, partial [termite gut metagenome]
MCWGIVFCNLTDIVILVFYAKKIIPVNFRMEIKILFPVVLSSLFMGIGIYFLIHFFAVSQWKLLLGVVTGAVLYTGMCVLLKLPEVNFLINNSLKLFRK